MKKSSHEIEGHFYHCMKCGRFYRIINGQQVQQPKAMYAVTNCLNFSVASKHKCDKYVHPNILHGDRRKRLVGRRGTYDTVRRLI